jgi:hypothetical protein
VSAGAPSTPTDPVLLEQSLPEPEDDPEQDQGADRGKNAEEASPVQQCRQLPSDHGCDDRGQPGQHDDATVVARELPALVDVPSRGLGNHEADGASQPLDEAQSDENGGGGAERTQRRGDDEDDQADDQRTPATVAVGDRPCDHLAERQPEQARGHGQLRGRGACVQVPSERGQDRQVEVHGRRAQDRQQRQDRRNTTAHRGCPRVRHTSGAGNGRGGLHVQDPIGAPVPAAGSIRTGKLFRVVLMAGSPLLTTPSRTRPGGGMLWPKSS